MRRQYVNKIACVNASFALVRFTARAKSHPTTIKSQPSETLPKPEAPAICRVWRLRQAIGGCRTGFARPSRYGADVPGEQAPRVSPGRHSHGS